MLSNDGWPGLPLGLLRLLLLFLPLLGWCHLIERASVTSPGWSLVFCPPPAPSSSPSSSPILPPPPPLLCWELTQGPCWPEALALCFSSSPGTHFQEPAQMVSFPGSILCLPTSSASLVPFMIALFGEQHCRVDSPLFPLGCELLWWVAVFYPLRSLWLLAQARHDCMLNVRHAKWTLTTWLSSQ